MNNRGARVCAVAVVGLAVLAGCGKDKHEAVATSTIQTPTTSAAPSLPSPSTTTGITAANSAISISELRVVTDGTDAAVEMTMTNTTAAADQLTAVSSPGQTIKIYSAGDASSNAPSTETTVPIPAKGSTSITLKGTTIDYTGDFTPPTVGTKVPLTFTFKTNGTVTMDAPVLSFSK